MVCFICFDLILFIYLLLVGLLSRMLWYVCYLGCLLLWVVLLPRRWFVCVVVFFLFSFGCFNCCLVGVFVDLVFGYCLLG